MTDSEHKIIATIYRSVDSVPRRTASETWRVIAVYFLDLLAAHKQLDLLDFKLAELTELMQMWISLHAISSVTLTCGESLIVDLAVIYASGSSSDNLDLPISSLVDPAVIDRVTLTIRVPAQLRDAVNIASFENVQPNNFVLLGASVEESVTDSEDLSDMPSPESQPAYQTGEEVAT